VTTYTDEYYLPMVIVDAIKAFDAANPKAHGETSLAEQVINLLKDK